MALHPCPECAAQVSSLATSCPKCGCPVSAAKSPAVGKLKKSKPAGHVGTVPGCLVILLTFGGIAVVASRNSSPDNRQQSQDEPRRAVSPGLLRVQRQDATKHVLRGVLRDPDSATFTFEERGPNALRVRVRAENAFGGHVVQTFDLSFPPGSVVASQVQEVQ